MEKSEDIKELATALSAAQGKIENAKKTTENPFFKKKYADMASCWDAIRGPLSENNLCIIQTTQPDDSAVIVETTLLHTSGQWVSGTIKMPPVKKDPQGFGSAMTYARRYGLMAIVGLAPEEDDGNSATPPEKNKQQPNNHPQDQRKPQPPKSKKVDVTADYIISYIDNELKAGKTDTQLEALWEKDILPILASFTGQEQIDIKSNYNCTLTLMREEKA